MDNLQIGQRIQYLRTAHSLSVRKLSAMAGITPSMLSQIENEQVNPSVNTLRSIAHALNIPLYSLFINKPDDDPIVHPDTRRIIGSKNEPDVYYELLTMDTQGAIEFCMMVIPPGCCSYQTALSHAGEEVAYVLCGSVELELGSNQYLLNAGDSVRIEPQTTHLWHNRSDDTAQVIFAVTPPTF